MQYTNPNHRYKFIPFSCKAVVNHKAARSDQLSIIKGEIYTVHSINKTLGWWYATRDGGYKGVWVPSKYFIKLVYRCDDDHIKYGQYNTIMLILQFWTRVFAIHGMENYLLYYVVMYTVMIAPKIWGIIQTDYPSIQVYVNFKESHEYLREKDIEHYVKLKVSEIENPNKIINLKFNKIEQSNMSKGTGLFVIHASFPIELRTRIEPLLEKSGQYSIFIWVEFGFLRNKNYNQQSVFHIESKKFKLEISR